MLSPIGHRRTATTVRRRARSRTGDEEEATSIHLAFFNSQRLVSPYLVFAYFLPSQERLQESFKYSTIVCAGLVRQKRDPLALVG